MAITNTCIRWDTHTKDYDVFIRGQYVGSRKHHTEAMELCNEESLKRARADAKAVKS
jgi:hypothetical protein